MAYLEVLYRHWGWKTKYLGFLLKIKKKHFKKNWKIKKIMNKSLWPLTSTLDEK